MLLLLFEWYDQVTILDVSQQLGCCDEEGCGLIEYFEA